MARTAKKSTRKKPTPSRHNPFPSLESLSRDLLWTWKPPIRRALEMIDPQLWEATNHNPIRVLQELDPARREMIAKDAELGAALADAQREAKDYADAPTWFDRTATPAQRKMLVAYFCMEYGLHESLPLYAGGLGILAADHLKSASDLGIPLIAIGVLWKKGYYRQEIRADGTVRVVYPETDFDSIPVAPTGKTITVPIGPSKVKVKIWRLQVGRVPLYLLDADLPANAPKDRKLTHHLYGGGPLEYRVRQEVLLGIGGLMALDALRIKPTVFHLNEGHAAFCPLERVRREVAKGAALDKAIGRIRASSVFTTHTPVPEGNDRFPASLIKRYLPGFAKALGANEKDFLALGREDPRDKSETFCMTVLALKLAQHCNGVAELHAETSRTMWMNVFGASSPDQVPIGHVTNGIHPETWIADEARPFYAKHLRPRWIGAGPEDDWWKRAAKIPPEELWRLRQLLRRKLIAQLRHRIRQQMLAKHLAFDQLAELVDTLDEDALTIGFARRFALYKRAPLIFKNARRLTKIMGSPDRPVQLVFAGKAHPQDQAGHDYVKLVYDHSRRAPFRGRVYLVENYDTAIGRMLTQGCDVWLNNPIRPMEASGTSGMKPPLNGGLNASIPDGWWPEGFNGKNGWMLGGQQFASRAKQDAFDANAIYHALEKEIVPAFYDRDRKGVPRAWTRLMGESMASIPAAFSTHRMLADYLEGYYAPAHASRTSASRPRRKT